MDDAEPPNPEETPMAALAAMEAASQAWIAEAYNLAQARLMGAETDLLKGMIAFNGAGLVSVISLAKGPVGFWGLDVALWLFFMGLACAVACWRISMAQWAMILGVRNIFPLAKAELQKHPIANRPITEVFKTAEDLEKAKTFLEGAVTRIFGKMKAPTKAINRLTQASSLCFAAGALSLALSFQFHGATTTSADLGNQTRAASKPLAKPCTASNVVSVVRSGRESPAPSVGQRNPGLPPTSSLHPAPCNPPQ